MPETTSLGIRHAAATAGMIGQCVGVGVSGQKQDVFGRSNDVSAYTQINYRADSVAAAS